MKISEELPKIEQKRNQLQEELNIIHFQVTILKALQAAQQLEDLSKTLQASLVAYLKSPSTQQHDDILETIQALEQPLHVLHTLKHHNHKCNNR